MNKHELVMIHRYRLQTRGNHSSKFKYKPLYMYETNKLSNTNMSCLSVIHAREIREVHVRGTGYAPQGRPAGH